VTTLCIGLGIANLVTVRGTSKVPVVLAAVQNSFSTLGAVSYSGGSCGVDETNGVISAPGVEEDSQSFEHRAVRRGLFHQLRGGRGG